MKKIIFFLAIVCVLACSQMAIAQTTQPTGAQVLRTARSIYDQGRLHELPPYLEEHLNKNHINVDVEKVEAYKILVLTYIYLEEPEKADAAMLNILNTEHFFEPNASDPIEFKNLYAKFRVKPIFSYGAKFGVSPNMTYVRTLKNHYISGESRGNGEYNPNLGIHINGIFEKELSLTLGKKKINGIVISPEIGYSTQSFNYYNDRVSFSDGDELAIADHTIKQARLQLNALVQYIVLPKSGFRPYVSAGPSVGYLLSSSFDGQLLLEGGNGNTQSGLDNTDSYESLNFSVIASVGFKYKVSAIYITGDVRYQYGLNNVVNGSNRFKLDGTRNTIVTGFAYVDNDFSIDQFVANIGLVVPVFNPKKLIK